MVRWRPAKFHKFVNARRTVSLPLLLLSFAHFHYSLDFISFHRSTTDLLDSNEGEVYPYRFAIANASLFVMEALGLVLKGKLAHFQYLTDCQNFFFKIVIFSMITCCVAYSVVANIAVFGSQLNTNAFIKAMEQGMKQYPTGVKKSSVDRVQIKYACCGNEGYSDWFYFDWYDQRVGNMNDDVPFSCCSNEILIPCIHLNLRSYVFYVKYNWSSPTLWNEGCHHKFSELYLINYHWLAYSANLVAAVFLAAALCDRLIQTADDSFSYKDHLEGWILGSGPDLKSRVYTQQKEQKPCGEFNSNSRSSSNTQYNRKRKPDSDQTSSAKRKKSHE